MKPVSVWPAAIGGLVLGLALFNGCAKKAADTDLVATVGSAEIRAADLIDELERQQKMGRRADKNEALDDLITRKALLERAAALGFDRDPEVRRSYENLLIGKLKQTELEPRLRQIEVSPDELAASARSRRSEPGVLRSRLAVLYLRATPRTSEGKLEQLRSFLTEARTRALQQAPDTLGFGELAVDYSEDQATRYTGGDIGWFEHHADKYNLPREVLEGGFALQTPGEVSDVIRATNGFYLVKLMGRTQSGMAANIESDAAIRHTLLLQKRKEIEGTFVKDARSGLSIQTYPENLERIQGPEIPAAQPRSIKITSTAR